MTKIDIFSGFLGAGKTTLIKKLLKEAFSGEQIVIIENEFGEIGIDSGFLKESGVQITEMNQGCICCSLVGDFKTSLKEVIDTYHPDRIIIEPSGVGKLSDVINAVENLNLDNIKLNSFVTVADATKVKVYMKNFGEFYNNQIENAGAVILSRTKGIDSDKLEKAVALLREYNDNAVVITTPWEELDGKDLLSALEGKDSLKKALHNLHHHDGEECNCHEHEHHHHHHHHEDGEECHCHEHDHEHHHHHHDEECDCGHHHHHHHADEVFTSFGRETVKKYCENCLKEILTSLDEGKCGTILRAKGIVENKDGGWLHFDYVPGEINIREGSAGVIGRLCVIGKDLDEEKLCQIFGI